MATIVYLHGFASVGDSAKSQAIRAAFPEETVIAPDLPVNPGQVIELVTGLVNDALATHPGALPMIFVGTSLGGFWANYFSRKFYSRAVLVNPSLQPSLTLANAVGSPVVNHKTQAPVVVTGVDLAEFELVENDLSAMYIKGFAGPDVFLAKDDDVIPYQRVLSQIGSQYRNLTITETGGHRYDIEWPRVVDQIGSIIGLNQN